MMKFARFFFMLGLTAFLGFGQIACTKLASDFDDESSTSEILKSGEDAFEKGDFMIAAEIFLKVDEYYPYSDDSRKALVWAMKSYSAGAHFIELRTIARKFLKSYPNDKNAPFAKYMVGMSYFDQIIDVERDQGATKGSIREFSELISFYPRSSYSAKAREHMKVAKNQLAGQEMAVGRYYLKRGNPLSALKRFQSVTNEHRDSPFHPESLYRTLESYLVMGVDQQALDTFRLLKKRFPDSDWTFLGHGQLKRSGFEDI